jgi:hypothetical protein
MGREKRKRQFVILLRKLTVHVPIESYTGRASEKILTQV